MSSRDPISLLFDAVRDFAAVETMRTGTDHTTEIRCLSQKATMHSITILIDGDVRAAATGSELHRVALDARLRFAEWVNSYYHGGGT